MSRRYWQLDVFAERPLTGNGLAVFDDASALDDAAMQAWTRELRQFESIFLLPGDDPRAFRARIFTLEEELPFAGHPLLGAAALLHHLRGGDNEQHWTLHLASKSVALRSVRAGSGFYAEMDQGRAEFGATPDAGTCRWFAEAFSLSANDLSGHPPRVVSTGLPYLLLPVTAEALGRARQVNDLQEALDKLGAAFVYSARRRRARGPHLGQPGAGGRRGYRQRCRSGRRLPGGIRACRARRTLRPAPGTLPRPAEPTRRPGRDRR